MSSHLVYCLYLMARNMYELKIPILPRLIQILIRVLFGCFLPYTAKIGKNTIISYGGVGTVLHASCVIGENCIINSGVTIGATHRHYLPPKIGNNVFIGTGAKVLGPIKIGDNVVIGANAVVTTDIPSNSLAAGVPAKIIKKNINVNEYSLPTH